MNCVVICLRDTSISPYKILEQVRVEVNIDASEDENFVDVAKALREFYGAVYPTFRSHLRDSSLNLYIGLWGNQGSFQLPPELVSLLARTFWTVEIDFNS